MTIAVGDKLPDGELMFKGENGPEKVSIAALSAGKKIVLFGVPGAFTPTCHGNHLPGFLEHYDALAAKGVEDIIVMSVNDIHVMKAWETTFDADDKIRFLADGSADYAKELDLVLDANAFGMGLRVQRFAMIVEDGIVKMLDVEEAPSSADRTGALAVLKAL